MAYARESADDEQYTVIVSTVGPGGEMPWGEPRVQAEYTMQATGLSTLAEVQLFMDSIAAVGDGVIVANVRLVRTGHDGWLRTRRPRDPL